MGCGRWQAFPQYPLLKFALSIAKYGSFTLLARVKLCAPSAADCGAFFWAWDTVRATDSAVASPVFSADKIKAPLLIAQGAKDPRVAKDESDQMVEAMKKRGVEVEYLVKDNEGHGFQNEENRFEFYEAMERFLKKHIGS